MRHRNNGAGEGAVEGKGKAFGPALILDGTDEPGRRVIVVAPDADVRAVGGLVVLVRQRLGRETVAIQNHGSAGSFQLSIHCI